MDLYEHQGKELFARHGINVSEGKVAFTPEQAEQAAQELGGQTVVKAQVHAGGRGKAGGVKLATDPSDAMSKATDILGLDIKGHIVHRLWIEKASDIDREYYFSINFDRTEKNVLLMLSTEGGMDIEQVAEQTPEKLATMHVDPVWGLRPYQARELAFKANIHADVRNKVIDMMLKLYDAFIAEDAMLVEVNPLLVTPEGEVKALDSKFTVDDNALFRHPDIAEMRDIQAQDPQEQMAHEKGVTYVKLDGEVGILGNGAGLVMSTLDVIKQSGGEAANFLDVGGGASADSIVASLEIILSDTKVKSIFFNIFGGITRCTEVANGIITALDRLEVNVPIVVRLDGTASKEGLEMLREANLPNVSISDTMLSAAAQAVKLAKNQTASV